MKRAKSFFSNSIFGLPCFLLECRCFTREFCVVQLLPKSQFTCSMERQTSCEFISVKLNSLSQCCSNFMVEYFVIMSVDSCTRCKQENYCILRIDLEQIVTMTIRYNICQVSFRRCCPRNIYFENRNIAFQQNPSKFMLNRISRNV